MKIGTLRRIDKTAAVIFGMLSVAFIATAFFDETFMQWVFARHHNQLSWYIRPLFLIPFCFFAYVRSLAGVAGTVFLVLTSMFWFPVPDVVDPQVATFLKMERDYLTGDWDAVKILLTMLVPLSMTVLGLAFWKRSLWLGISVLVFIAAAKMLWSVAFGGESGHTVIIPAVAALVICICFIWLGFRRLQK